MLWAAPDIKEGIVCHVHVLDVWIDGCHREAVMVVLCVDPPESIICINVVGLFFELIRPPPVTIGPGAMVLFAAPRIADSDQLRTIAQLHRAIDSEGVSIWHSNRVRILIRASACIASCGDHIAHFKSIINVLPRLIDAHV